MEGDLHARQHLAHVRVVELVLVGPFGGRPRPLRVLVGEAPSLRRGQMLLLGRRRAPLGPVPAEESEEGRDAGASQWSPILGMEELLVLDPEAPATSAALPVPSAVLLEKPAISEAA